MRRISTFDLHILKHEFQVRFALFCTYQVKDRWDKTPSCIEAVKIVELWLEGKASSEECRAAGLAADYAASGVVVSFTAFAAANVSNAGAYIANAADYAASNLAEILEQWDFYNELLHFDAIVEKALLGEEA